MHIFICDIKSIGNLELNACFHKDSSQPFKCITHDIDFSGF